MYPVWYLIKANTNIRYRASIFPLYLSRFSCYQGRKFDRWLEWCYARCWRQLVSVMIRWSWVRLTMGCRIYCRLWEPNIYQYCPYVCWRWEISASHVAKKYGYIISKIKLCKEITAVWLFCKHIYLKFLLILISWISLLPCLLEQWNKWGFSIISVSWVLVFGSENLSSYASNITSELRAPIKNFSRWFHRDISELSKKNIEIQP